MVDPGGAAAQQGQRTRGVRAALRALRETLLHRHVTAGRLGLAVGVGVFIGLTPFFGFHLILALAAAWLLRLNVTATVLATQVTNPLFAPVFVTASAWLGSHLGGGASLGQEGAWYDPTRPGFYVAWLRGALVLGAALGLPAGLATWGAAAWARRKRRA